MSRERLFTSCKNFLWDGRRTTDVPTENSRIIPYVPTLSWHRRATPLPRQIPLPNVEQHYGVHQYRQLRETLIFPKQLCLPTQSELQNVLAWSRTHIRIYLLLPDCDAPLTHIQSTVLISYNAIATADRNLASIVMYPPKINRKNYCTVQYCRKPLGPKMTYITTYYQN